MTRQPRPFAHNALTKTEEQAADLWDSGHSIEQIAIIMARSRDDASQLVSRIHGTEGNDRLVRNANVRATQQLADALANYVGSAA